MDLTVMQLMVILRGVENIGIVDGGCVFIKSYREIALDEGILYRYIKHVRLLDNKNTMPLFCIELR